MEGLLLVLLFAEHRQGTRRAPAVPPPQRCSTTVRRGDRGWPLALTNTVTKSIDFGGQCILATHIGHRPRHRNYFRLLLGRRWRVNGLSENGVQLVIPQICCLIFRRAEKLRLQMKWLQNAYKNRTVRPYRSSASIRHICHCCETCSRLWFSAAYCEISVSTITNMKTDIKVQIEPSSSCIKCFLCQKKIYPTRQPHNIPDSKPLCQKGSLRNQRAEHLTNDQFQPKERNVSSKQNYIHFQPKANHHLKITFSDPCTL